MKIAIIFLCLGIASFIDTSKGTDLEINPIDANKADCYARFVQSTAQKLEKLKSCPDAEKKTRLITMCEDVLYELKLLSFDIGCTMEKLCKLMELPDDISKCLQEEDLEALSEIMPNPDDLARSLLKPLLRVLQALLAKVGCILEPMLEELNAKLGCDMGDFSLLSDLKESVSEILNPLVGTVLGDVLGILQLLG